MRLGRSFGRPRPALSASPRLAVDSRALFERHCASCHDAPSRRRDLVRRDTSARAGLLRFLAHHGDAVDTQDRLIVDYLAGENSRPQP